MSITKLQRISLLLSLAGGMASACMARTSPDPHMDFPSPDAGDSMGDGEILPGDNSGNTGECAPELCGGRGDCVNSNGSQVCKCYAGYAGSGCGSCAAGYERAGAICQQVLSSGGAFITTVEVRGQSPDAQVNVPLTFAQVFSPGDVPAGMGLAATDSDAVAMPIQLDAKSVHPDGSLRHGLVSVLLPVLPAVGSAVVNLSSAAIQSPAATSLSLADLADAGFDAQVNFSIADESYSASTPRLNDSTRTIWLDGHLAKEWLVGVPVNNSRGVSHPHLAVYFHIRAYVGAPLRAVRVDVIVENNWTLVEGPGDVEYDVQVSVAGVEVFNSVALTHFHHARWRKTFFWGDIPKTSITAEMGYLQSSRAVPNYKEVLPTEAALDGLTDAVAPMDGGRTPDYMASTGEWPHIGPLPNWAALLLTSGDERAKRATLANGDAGGSWPVHYRDEQTGHAAIPLNHSGRQIGVRGFPVPLSSATTLKPDRAHQPSLAFLPYVLTGDYYYLEELLFWCAWNMMSTSPTTRLTRIGLQVRGQAWSLRTLGQAAYIAPDDHPLKDYLNTQLRYYIGQYTEAYIKNPTPEKQNTFGAIWSFADSRSAAKLSNAYFIPWMDDYFTWAIGYLSELGYTSADALRDWKCKFATRLGGDEWCWNLATPSSVQMGVGEAWYTSLAEVYATNFPVASTMECNSQELVDYIAASRDEGGDFEIDEMIKYGRQPWGHPSKLRPALAVCYDAQVPRADTAWSRLEGRAQAGVYDDEPRYGLEPRRSASVPASASIPDFIDRIPAGTFYEISTANGHSGNLNLDTVYSPNNGEGRGYSPKGIMSNWCSASYDWRAHQLVFAACGGHAYGGHYGNEIYTFGPLTADDPQFALRREMSVPSITTTGLYADGRPSATHTYDLVIFDPIARQHILVGLGATWNTNGMARPVVAAVELDPSHARLFDWDMAHQPVPVNRGAQVLGAWAEYDALTHSAFFRERGVGPLRKYDLTARTWTTLAGDGAFLASELSTAIDPQRRIAVGIGGYQRNNDMQLWRLDTGVRTAITNVSGPVDADFWNTDNRVQDALGFEWYPPTGQFVAYREGAIWILTPPENLDLDAPNSGAWSWEKRQPGGDTPGAEEPKGTWGRFRWAADIACFIFVHTTGTNVFLYKPDF